jgi:hypothetical protein
MPSDRSSSAAFRARSRAWRASCCRPRPAAPGAPWRARPHHAQPRAQTRAAKCQASASACGQDGAQQDAGAERGGEHLGRRARSDRAANAKYRISAAVMISRPVQLRNRVVCRTPGTGPVILSRRTGSPVRQTECPDRTRPLPGTGQSLACRRHRCAPDADGASRSAIASPIGSKVRRGAQSALPASVC